MASALENTTIIQYREMDSNAGAFPDPSHLEAFCNRFSLPQMWVSGGTMG